jgi:hypothetical protein
MRTASICFALRAANSWAVSSYVLYCCDGCSTSSRYFCCTEPSVTPYFRSFMPAFVGAVPSVRATSPVQECPYGIEKSTFSSRSGLM